MTSDHQTVDAVVVGAGFAGLYLTHRLQNDLGLDVLCIDAADAPGGTWAWNRYPGAKSDSESFTYRYSFDPDFYAKTANWKRRYLSQEEILEYFATFVEHFDLAERLQMATRVTCASWDEAAAEWTIETDNAERIRAKYFFPALGPLSAKKMPTLAGEDDFKGKVYHTSEYPSGVSLKGKKVGVIGTGSTGTQVVAAVAPEVGELTVFQRTPQWCVPAGDAEVSTAEREQVVREVDQIFGALRRSGTAFGFEDSAVEAASVSDEERRRIFEEAWEVGGGFYFMFATFCDLAVNEQANAWACEFMEEKIRETVIDQEIAERLIPDEPYARRPVCENGFYAAFNQDNVDLVSIKDNPIIGFSESGLELEDGTVRELDVVIMATGFDAVDGSYGRVDIRGRDDRTLHEEWSTGAKSYMGISVPGFPNMLSVFGPQSAFCNNPPLIESQVDFVADLVAHAEETNAATVEVRQEALDRWLATCVDLASQTLFAGIEDSWIFGRNIEGKADLVLFYFKGLGDFRDDLQRERDMGYAAYQLGNPVGV